jgi:DNA-binding CsgD family transcriptional regulator
MNELLDTFMKNVSAAMLPVEAGAHFADLAEQFGYPECVVIALLEPTPIPPVAYWRTAGDAEEYARNNPPGQNPLAQYAFAVDVPFDVPTASAALGYREADVRRVLYPVIMDKHIVVFPVHRRGSLVLYAGCAGDKPDDTPHTRALLHLAAHATYDVMAAVEHNRDLTQREAACLKSIARGNSYSATGALLGISQRTVRAAIASAKTKLHARTQSELLAKALGTGVRGAPNLSDQTADLLRGVRHLLPQRQLAARESQPADDVRGPEGAVAADAAEQDVSRARTML